MDVMCMLLFVLLGPSSPLPRCKQAANACFAFDSMRMLGHDEIEFTFSHNRAAVFTSSLRVQGLGDGQGPGKRQLLTLT